MEEINYQNILYETSILRKAWLLLITLCIVASLFSLGIYILDKNCQKSTECVGSEEQNIHDLTKYLLKDAKITIACGFFIALVLFIFDYYLTSTLLNKNNKKENE